MKEDVIAEIEKYLDGELRRNSIRNTRKTLDVQLIIQQVVTDIWDIL